MGKTLYLDCANGISGDMVVGALLDAGASEEGLRVALASLGVAGFDVRITRRTVSSLSACDFDVVLDAEHDGHDHDMGWLYGGLDAHGGQGEGHHGDGGHPHDHAGGYGHDHHAHDHHHDHGGGHDHHAHEGGHDHHHEHRGPAEVKAIIDAGALSPRTRALARRVFDIIADAEARAHGVPLDQVHFHEVGAVDSIVDVVAAAFCLDDLGIDDVVVSPLAEGHGRIRSQHGVLTVPVPAVAHIVERAGLVLELRDVHAELVTPTGAAIAAAFRTADALPARYRVVASGIGSGKRAYDPPSTLRALVVEAVEGSAPAGDGRSPQGPPLWKLETEVDDCTGEALGHVLDRLLGLGAREAHFIPTFMKKGRPGYQLEVLCEEGLISALELAIFEDTTTIGIRRSPVWRTTLPREGATVETPYGTAQVKRVTLPTGEVRSYPEHASIEALAREAKAPYQTVYQAVIAAARA